eukprot:gene3464-3930_t
MDVDPDDEDPAGGSMAPGAPPIAVSASEPVQLAARGTVCAHDAHPPTPPPPCPRTPCASPSPPARTTHHAQTDHDDLTPDVNSMAAAASTGGNLAIPRSPRKSRRPSQHLVKFPVRPSMLPGAKWCGHTMPSGAKWVPDQQNPMSLSHHVAVNELVIRSRPPLKKDPAPPVQAHVESLSINRKLDAAQKAEETLARLLEDQGQTLSVNLDAVKAIGEEAELRLQELR